MFLHRGVDLVAISVFSCSASPVAASTIYEDHVLPSMIDLGRNSRANVGVVLSFVRAARKGKNCVFLYYRLKAIRIAQVEKCSENTSRHSPRIKRWAMSLAFGEKCGIDEYGAVLILELSF